MHSGSNYALFPDREWSGTKENNHKPTSRQIEIREQFLKYAAEVRTARKGKRVKVVHNGDAIDGDHHRSGDVCTVNLLEQAKIHVELMTEFQKLIDWQRGDEIYYTRGTQTHVNEMETYIGEQMNAVPYGIFYVHDLLRLEINGTVSSFVHHGPARGDGPNEGNPIRNWLRNIQQEAIKDGKPVGDGFWVGHVHYPSYCTYIWRDKMNFKTMHGIITPSWQLKTSFGWQVASMKSEKIGGTYQEIKADGTMGVPRFSIMGYE